MAPPRGNQKIFMQREAGSFLILAMPTNTFLFLRQGLNIHPRWHETCYVALAGIELATIRVLCLQACHETLQRHFLALEVQNSSYIRHGLGGTFDSGDASPEPAGMMPKTNAAASHQPRYPLCYIHSLAPDQKNKPLITLQLAQMV